MSQMARDACATLILINALQGVSMRWGTSAPQARPWLGDRLDPGWVHSWRVPRRTRRVAWASSLLSVSSLLCCLLWAISGSVRATCQARSLLSCHDRLRHAARRHAGGAPAAPHSLWQQILSGILLLRLRLLAALSPHEAILEYGESRGINDVARCVQEECAATHHVRRNQP